MSEEIAKGMIEGVKKQGMTCWYAFMIGLAVVGILNNIDNIKKL